MASVAGLRQKACVWLLAIIEIASATCYRPDGSPAATAYKPCNGSVPVSMCCHLGVGNNNGDACGSGSSYGLCGITGSQIWRESCTDPTWNSPTCLKLCINGAEDQMITACPDGSYCCGSNNASCCDAGQGQFIVNNLVSNSSPTLSLSTSSSVASAVLPSTTPNANSTPSPKISASATSFSLTSDSSSSASTNSVNGPIPNGLSTSAIIGLSIGITIALMTSALLVVIFIWKRKKHSKRFPTNLQDDARNNQMEKTFGVVASAATTNRSEIGSENTPHEASGRPSHRVEIDDGGLTMGYGLPTRAAELPASSKWKH